MTIDLGLLLDGVFSLGRTKCGKLTEEIISLQRRMIKATIKLWKYLRFLMMAPKIHGIDDHLLEQMIRWDGIGEYAEDFIKQAHQFGVKEELRTRGMFSKTKTAIA